MTKPLPRKESKFYNFNRILSFNAQYNFIAGARGIGKTYGAKVKSVKDSIRRGDEFIYLRRYKTEIKAAKMTFFDDFIHEFPEYDFQILGDIAQRAPVETRSERKREWTTIGYFVALSNSQSKKSVTYPRVRTIIFDEFITESGNLRYLADEFTVFNNLYNTVDRYRDQVRVLFLANAVSIMNPYFIELDIRPDTGFNDITVMRDGFVAVHFPDSESFRNFALGSRFGRFIDGTGYAEYAIGNQFRDNETNLVLGKPSHADYYCSIDTKFGGFSVWADGRAAEFFVQKKLPRNNNWFTLVPVHVDRDRTLLTYGDPLLSRLRTAFRQGRMLFDTPATRNAFVEIFKR